MVNSENATAGEPSPVAKVSPCRVACPLENEIPRWLDPFKRGNFGAAWQIIKSYNPFPAITGYCCYRLCEAQCNRAHWDEAVSIGELEKVLGLWRLEHYEQLRNTGQEMPYNHMQGIRVAVAGSGPAGLSCAFYLNMLGAAVTVFEQLPRAGGLLATGIPESRLPRELLQRELEILQAGGVEFQTGAAVGLKAGRASLVKRFAAVVLATGAQESIPLNVPGEGLAGVHGAVEFLRDLYLGRLTTFPEPVVIVGGGNAALDAAVAARAAGAKKVTLLYRRSRGEMPAHPIEIGTAESAGVEFHFQAAVTEILGTAALERIKVAKTAPSQRDQAVTILPSSYSLECRTLLVAAGQRSSLAQLDHFFYNPMEKKQAEKGKVWRQEGALLMAAGDAVSGPNNVARAIFSGRQAALTLAKILPAPEKTAALPDGFFIAPPRNPEDGVVTLDSLNPFFYPRRSRNAVPQQEAARCFSCGFCNNCGVCRAFCPDLAVEQLGDGPHINPSFCKSCNICVTQCPANALEMHAAGQADYNFSR